MKKGVDFVDPKPLYEQIGNDIRERIVRGELKPGERIETHHELAKRYNVSLITVKNALATLINEGFLFSRAGKGTYVAERQSRKPDRSKERIIGVVLRDLKHPYFSMVVHSIEERAYELGYHIVLSSSSESLEKEESQIDRFRELGVQGLIIASLSYQYRATEYIRRLHDTGFPYVMVSYIHDPDYWFVGSDHEHGGFIGTEHLINLGYTSVGYVHVGNRNLLSEIRKNGYSRALMEHEIPFSSDRVFVLDTETKNATRDRFQLGYSFGKGFPAIAKKPDALLFYNDMVAIGFLQGAGEAGVRVPDDVAIVGYDDSAIAQYASVPLSTVHQPVDKIGRLAVETVHKRVENVETGNRIVLKPTIVVRESCGAHRKGLFLEEKTEL
jgi:GntR family transcriptional regulator, arabinose operon transcriptional repressor